MRTLDSPTKALLYVIPIGMVEDHFITTIELYIPNLDVAINAGNSQLINKEESREKYEDLEPIKEIDILQENLTSIIEFVEILKSKQKSEEKILTDLESVISQAIQKFQTEPQIHIPTADEVSQISGQSGLILEE